MLVSHSYGGMVITGVPADAGEIIGRVYVCAFAPEPGDTCKALAARFPGSTLGEALRPVPRGDRTTDLYTASERFRARFCADVPAPEAARMAATQRPVTLEALTEPSGERPLWREVPSWFLIAAPQRAAPAPPMTLACGGTGAAANPFGMIPSRPARHGPRGTGCGQGHPRPCHRAATRPPVGAAAGLTRPRCKFCGCGRGG